MVSYVFNYVFWRGFQPSQVSLLIAIPVLAALFDLTEDAIIINLLLTYPEPSLIIAKVASIFSFGKWVLIILTVFVIFIGLIFRLMKNSN